MEDGAAHRASHRASVVLGRGTESAVGVSGRARFYDSARADGTLESSAATVALVDALVLTNALINKFGVG